jgi:hypothetical protein
MAQIILDSNNNLIQGDFDNATLNNRTKLQTTTTNATTNVYVAPNGSATSAGVSVANNSSLTNASKIVMATNGSTDTQIISGVNGSGTYLPLSFYTNNTLAGQFDTSGNLSFNSGYGSAAVAYGCRAWVNFNGTGTVAIRASGNVTSITDNGTGDYTVNFTTAMPDVNYSAVATGYSDRTGTGTYGIYVGINTLATGSFQLDVLAGASAFAYFDSLFVTVAVFR